MPGNWVSKMMKIMKIMKNRMDKDLVIRIIIICAVLIFSGVTIVGCGLPQENAADAGNSPSGTLSSTGDSLSAGETAPSMNIAADVDNLELRVFAAGDGDLLFSAAVSENKHFTISYHHSVSSSPVTGMFSVNKDCTITPVYTRFTSFGPGLPWTAGDETEYTRFEDGTVQVDHPLEARNELRLWVSPLTRDVLAVGGSTVPLTQWSDREKLILITVNGVTGGYR